MQMRSIMLKQSLGIAILALAALGTRVSAQTLPPPWNVQGSDTLENIMKDSITRAAATAGFEAAGQLVYVGGGSGTGETAMLNNIQSIAPMSRNLKQSVMTANPTWTPTVRNVVGLDAAVLVTKNTTARCKNIQLPVFDDTATGTKKASPNDTASSTYTQIIEVILSGVDGSGSVAACSDPRRIQAVLDLANCQGSGIITHFYRRDDNSGTTDTFKDKIAVQRFCNGAARGVLGSNTTNPNLNNQDLDPIRFRCPTPGTLPDGTLRRATSCTNIATGAACTAADNAAFPGCEATNTCPCTQGLVVALSAGDNTTTLADVTTTIASRVAADSAGTTFGYAGREAVRQQGAPTGGPYINRTSYSDAVVRLDNYLLSRRLYLQYAPGNTDANGPTNPPAPPGGGAPRVAAELALYGFMTDDGTANPDGSVGACNIKDIVKKHGFITCTDTCDTPPTGSSNLCSKSPYPPGPSFPVACIPTSSSGGPAWGYGTVSCTSGQICCSTGAACPAGGTCPAANGRPADAACTRNSDCASGSCTDVQGIGVLQCG